MKQIPILGIGIQSGFPSVTAQERINCYVEELKDGEKSKVVVYGSAGKTTWIDLGDTPIRGGISFGDYLYVVHRNNFYQINNAAVATVIGTISTSSGAVSMATTGFEIFIADGTANAYVYTIATGILAASNSPAISTCTFLDGFIVGNEVDTGKYYWSGIYDALTWNALDFATAESNPDNLVAVFNSQGSIMLSGTFTTELIGNSAGEDSPFSRIGYPLEWGLMAKSSIAKLGDSVAFLARNRMGEAQVVMMSGYNVQRISTHDLERILNASSTLEASTALSYMINGHQFYQLNAAGTSWLFDTTTGMWTQLKSYGIDRDKGEFGFNLINRILVSDYATGKLYELSSDVYADDSDPLVMELTGKHVFSGAEWITISELDLEMENGNGVTTGQGEIPMVSLQVSKDQGHTFCNERWASSGMIGKYKTLIRWPRIGRSYNFNFKIKISDPVKRAIVGAWIIAK